MIINHLKSASADLTKHFLFLGNKKSMQSPYYHPYLIQNEFLKMFYEKEVSVMLNAKQPFWIPLYYCTKRDLIMTVTSS